MANSYQVTHHRPDGGDWDRRIEGLAGPNGNGGLWYHDLDYLIEGIKKSWYQLWTVDQNNNSVWIVVAERNNREYLKTQSDGVDPNNLLSLPTV